MGSYRQIIPTLKQPWIELSAMPNSLGGSTKLPADNNVHRSVSAIDEAAASFTTPEAIGGSFRSVQVATDDAQTDMLRNNSMARRKISEGLLRMLSVGHRVAGEESCFRQRPNSAGANLMRARTALGRSSNECVQRGPSWVTSGPPVTFQGVFLGTSERSPTASPRGSSAGKPDPSLKWRSSNRMNASTRSMPGEAEDAATKIMQDFLLTLPLLSHVPRDKLAPVVHNLTSTDAKYGAVLQREGEEPAGIIIIWNGTVAVERSLVTHSSSPEARILSSCMRRPATSRADIATRSGASSSPSSPTNVCQPVVGRCGRGAVFGDFAVLHNVAATETVRVDAIGGAHVIRIAAESLKEHISENLLTPMRSRAREVGRWRERQASRMSGSLTTARFHFSNVAPSRIPFPSLAEIQRIKMHAREDAWKPMNWREKLAAQLKAEEAVTQQLARSQTREFKKKQRLGQVKYKRPASALLGNTTRRQGSRARNDTLVSVDKIDNRKLHLTTWKQPDHHRVHLGTGVRGDSAAAFGYHVHLHVDALKSLDGSYLEKFD